MDTLYNNDVVARYVLFIATNVLREPVYNINGISLHALSI